MYRVIASIFNDEQALYFRPLVRGGQEGIVYFSFFLGTDFTEKHGKRFPTHAGAGLGAGSAILRNL